MVVPAAFATSVVTLGIGAGITYFVAAQCAANNDSEDGGAGLNCLPAPAATALLASAAVVVGPAVMTMFIEKQRGIDGSLGLSILGSSLGVLAGGALGIALGETTELELAPVFVIAGASMSALATTGAVFFYNVSARSRARRTASALLPTLAALEERGVMLGISGSY